MIKIPRTTKIIGRIEVPGDKSISHRLLFFGSFASGQTKIQNVAPGDDVKRTILALKKLGISIQREDDWRTISGRQGLFSEPAVPLHCGNSGTTARLLMGLLSSQPFYSVMFGDASLHRRPMGRLTYHLRQMGAQITGRQNGEFLPISIQGNHLRGGTHRLEIPSAQIKSALLLAGLRAEGDTRIIELARSRDHSERLLKFMGGEVEENGSEIKVRPQQLHAVEYKIPGDFSSAAFFLTLALLHPKAEIEIRSVGLNPTRTGLLEVYKQMGGNIEVDVESNGPEPAGTIRARSSHLRGFELVNAMLPTLIDEIPLLALAATQASGRTVVRGAGELRSKESDRIRSTVLTLRKFGAHIEELSDGFMVEGPTQLYGCTFQDYKDHRIVMMQSIAGTLTKKVTIVTGDRWVNISYPSFFKDLFRIIRS